MLYNQNLIDESIKIASLRGAIEVYKKELEVIEALPAKSEGQFDRKMDLDVQIKTNIRKMEGEIRQIILPSSKK